MSFQIIDLADEEVFASFEDKDRLVNALERYASQYPMFVLDLGVRDTCACTIVEAESLLS